MKNKRVPANQIHIDDKTIVTKIFWVKLFMFQINVFILTKSIRRWWQKRKSILRLQEAPSVSSPAAKPRQRLFPSRSFCVWGRLRRGGGAGSGCVCPFQQFIHGVCWVGWFCSSLHDRIALAESTFNRSNLSVLQFCIDFGWFEWWSSLPRWSYGYANGEWIFIKLNRSDEPPSCKFATCFEKLFHILNSTRNNKEIVAKRFQNFDFSYNSFSCGWLWFRVVVVFVVVAMVLGGLLSFCRLEYTKWSN